MNEIYDIPLLVQRAHAVADETRVRLLLALLEGEATVSDLVTRLHLPQPRVSTHLAVLRQAGLVSVEASGQQRVYRPDAERVRTVFDALNPLSPRIRRRSPQAAREVRRNTALRQARTCYDHLAGVAGVQLLDTMCERGWIEVEAGATGPRPPYHLTPAGEMALLARGVNLTQARRPRRRLAYGCPDWTERRLHLGGGLGAQILEVLRRSGTVRRQSKTRAITLQQPLTAWLDVPARSE